LHLRPRRRHACGLIRRHARLRDGEGLGRGVTGTYLVDTPYEERRTGCFNAVRRVCPIKADPLKLKAQSSEYETLSVRRQAAGTALFVRRVNKVCTRDAATKISTVS